MLPNSAAIAASNSVQDDAPVAGSACVVAPATAPAGDTAVGATGTGPAESTDPEDGVTPDGVPEESVVVTVRFWTKVVASHTLTPSIQASNTTSAGGGASMYDSE